MWSGAGMLDGHPELDSLDRAELSGLVVVLHIALSICEYFILSTSNKVIYCDSQCVLKHVQRQNYFSLKAYTVAVMILLSKDVVFLH